MSMGLWKDRRASFVTIATDSARGLRLPDRGMEQAMATQCAWRMPNAHLDSALVIAKIPAYEDRRVAQTAARTLVPDIRHGCQKVRQE